MRLKTLFALAFGIAGSGMLWQGGGFIWLGVFFLIAGLLVLVKPDNSVLDDSTAVAEHENLRHGHPSRDTTRSDYFLGGPPGGGPGDGGAV